MSPPLFLLLILVLLISAANAQPSPGYYPSSMVRTSGFNAYLANRWGPQHQSVSADGNSLTIWLDKNSGGSGFKSRTAYRGGYFGVSMKLQGGYTAGVIASFYLSNNEAYPGYHDEVDIEFLGTIPGRPYVLQTNVYVKGSGDGSNMVGREMRFNLWFDPTAGFHHYAILWAPDQIVFFVDDVPIRQYLRKSSATFPERPMWVYGSIWDASSWATDGGRYRADYRYQPFVARYTGFKINACPSSAPATCRTLSPSPTSGGLSAQQTAAMRWAQSTHMVYYYCTDATKDRARTPECGT